MCVESALYRGSAIGDRIGGRCELFRCVGVVVRPSSPQVAIAPPPTTPPLDAPGAVYSVSYYAAVLHTFIIIYMYIYISIYFVKFSVYI